MKTLNDFKAFILRGNVVDLAIGIVIGAAFTSVVNSLVADVFTPLIAALFGKPDFSYIAFNIGNGRIAIGSFLNAIISFLIVAAVLFFLVVRPVNLLVARRT